MTKKPIMKLLPRLPTRIPLMVDSTSIISKDLLTLISLYLTTILGRIEANIVQPSPELVVFTSLDTFELKFRETNMGFVQSLVKENTF